MRENVNIAKQCALLVGDVEGEHGLRDAEQSNIIPVVIVFILAILYDAKGPRITVLRTICCSVRLLASLSPPSTLAVYLS